MAVELDRVIWVGELLRFICAHLQHPDWPRYMTSFVELFETVKPYDRVAVSERVEMLVQGCGGEGGLGPLIMDQPLCSLHPASW